MSSRSSSLRTFLPAIPGSLTIFILLVMPLGLMVYYSFVKFIPGTITDGSFTFENYVRLFSNPYYISIIWSTVQMGLVVTLVSICFGYPVAYFINQIEGRMHFILLFIVFMPMMISLVVRAYGWMVLLGYNGVVNSFLLWAGLIDQPLRMLNNFHAVVVGLVEVMLPFMIVPILASLRNIERSVEEAARALGASPFQTFLKVTAPLSLPGIISGSLMVFSLTITAYALPALLGGGQVKMISSLAYEAMLVSYNWPFGSAIGIVMVLVSTAMIYGYLRLLPKRDNARV